MDRRLRGLVGALKDKASLGRATLLCSSPSATNTVASAPSSPGLAVLRVTTHHPASSPPPPRHIDALLAFGHGSRLAAAACVDALVARLCSTHHPSVALKSLLAAHHLLSRGSFILRDQLAASLRPSSGRNPLNLSAFRYASSPESWAVSAWVRWLARLLELLLAAAWVVGEADDERVTSMLNGGLLIELDALVAVVEEVVRAPEATDNGLVAEAVRLAEEDMLTAERGILVRVREMAERLGLLRFSEMVELVCLLKRLEECGDRPVGGPWRARPREWFWSEVRGVMMRVRDIVVREEEERGRVTRDRVSVSARLMSRVPLLASDPNRSGSGRWDN